MTFYTLKNRPKSKPLTAKGGVTQQHFKEECDVNNVVRNYMRTGCFGLPGQMPTQKPSFEGFDQDFSFHAAQVQLCKAREAFDNLPSTIRKRFANDPAQLLDFLNDSSNRKEAEQLGLVDPLPVPEAPQTGVIHTDQIPINQGPVVGNSEVTPTA